MPCGSFRCTSAPRRSLQGSVSACAESTHKKAMTECSCCSPEETMLWQTNTELQLSSCHTRYQFKQQGGQQKWHVGAGVVAGMGRCRARPACLHTWVHPGGSWLLHSPFLTPLENMMRTAQMLHLNQQLWLALFTHTEAFPATQAQGCP